MTESEFIIPININEFILLIGVALVVLAVHLRQKYLWKNSEFLGIGFFLVLFIGTVLMAPLSVQMKWIPDEPVDRTIMIDARIKPWTFNITAMYDGNNNPIPIDQSKYKERPGGAGFGKTMIYDTIELEVGVLYSITFEAIDTDHGLIVEGLKDGGGFSIKESLSAHKLVSVYVRATEADIGTYTYFCNFFCGKDHGDMRAEIEVKEQAQGLAKNTSVSFQIPRETIQQMEVVRYNKSASKFSARE